MHKKITRRTSFRLSAAALATGFTSCASLSSVIRPNAVLIDRIRKGNRTPFTAAQLGFKKDKLPISPLFTMLEAKGLTGISMDSGMWNGTSLQAITADWQKLIHILMDAKYHQSVPVNTRGIKTHSFSLKFSKFSGISYLLAVYRDAERSKCSQMDIFFQKNGLFVPFHTLTLDFLPGGGNNLSYPLLFGNDLKRGGVYLFGRYLNGDVWRSIPAIRFELIKGELKFRVDFHNLDSLRGHCGYIDSYIDGTWGPFTSPYERDLINRRFEDVMQSGIRDF